MENKIWQLNTLGNQLTMNIKVTILHTAQNM